MTDRNTAFLALRPTVNADPDAASSDVERFFHATLRPVLKLQNETLLTIVARGVGKRVKGLADFAPDDQRERLMQALAGDSRLKRTLVGVVYGMLTAQELAFALDHEAEVRRRIVSLLGERVRSQSEAVAQRVKM